MISSVSLACKNYFEGFQDLSTFNTNNSSKNAIGVLKVVSYFTLVIPLFVGLIYGVSSLVGRVTVEDNQSPENLKTSAICRKILGVEEQLEQFFKSTTKNQKLFTIDGTKIGIIFNPGGESLKLGFMTVTDPVVLVSEISIPEEVSSKIIKQIPQNCSHSTMSMGSINGQSTFVALGFE